MSSPLRKKLNNTMSADEAGDPSEGGFLDVPTIAAGFVLGLLTGVLRKSVTAGVALVRARTE